MNLFSSSRTAAVIGFVLVTFLSAVSFAQTKRRTILVKNPSLIAAKTPVAIQPKVTKVDDARLRELLKPNGKPLLVNFWATWCDPCREEFPDLVKINADYKGKIDFITVTLDDAEDINGSVPKFLFDMKAPMPSYLLVSSDESAIISTIAKDWSGGLPFTVLYNEKGGMAYFRQGKVKVDLLRSELDRLVRSQTPAVETGTR